MILYLMIDKITVIMNRMKIIKQITYIDDF